MLRALSQSMEGESRHFNAVASQLRMMSMGSTSPRNSSPPLELDDFFNWMCLLDGKIRQYPSLQDSTGSHKAAKGICTLMRRLPKTAGTHLQRISSQPAACRQWNKEARRWGAQLEQQFRGVEGLPGAIRFTYVVALVDLAIYTPGQSDALHTYFLPKSIWKRLEGNQPASSAMLLLMEAILGKIEGADDSDLGMHLNVYLVNLASVVQFPCLASDSWSLYSKRWGMQLVCRLQKPMEGVLRVARRSAMAGDVLECYETLNDYIYHRCWSQKLHQSYVEAACPSRTAGALTETASGSSCSPVEDLETKQLVQLVNSYQQPAAGDKQMADSYFYSINIALECICREAWAREGLPGGTRIIPQSVASHLMTETGGKFADVFCSILQGLTFPVSKAGKPASSLPWYREMYSWPVHFIRLVEYGHMSAAQLRQGVTRLSQQLRHLLNSDPNREPTAQRLWMLHTHNIICLGSACTALLFPIFKENPLDPAGVEVLTDMQGIAEGLNGCEHWSCWNRDTEEDLRDMLRIRASIRSIQSSHAEITGRARSGFDQILQILAQPGEGREETGSDLTLVSPPAGSYPPAGERQIRGTHSAVLVGSRNL